MILLVATTNPKKLVELKTLLSDTQLTLASLPDFSGIQEVAETGKTFEENAVLKAQGYARQTGLLTLAEDSGLCCDALDGAPGVYSARFAGTQKNDLENNLKLLKLMENLPDNCRTAYFKSVVSIATPEEVVGTVEGSVHGYISREILGRHGFGYDPVFYFPPYSKTFGEVEPALKDKVSHRAFALEKAKQLLVQHLHLK